MKTLLMVAFLIIVINETICTPKKENCKLINTYTPLNFTELAQENGFQAREYEVKTEDGYLLGLFRIPGKRGLPIFLMHGVTDSSDTWLLRGNTSLGVTLARENYDVWFGNVRGNKYSRRHVDLNPDKHAAFWDFSFHEHGFYDLPAMIDAILRTSGYKKLNAFGHSQGNAIFYVLGSSRPEYNDKVNVMTALAPICFLSNVPPPLSSVFDIAPQLNEGITDIGLYEVYGNTSPVDKVGKAICKQPVVGYKICAIGGLFPFAGLDVEEFSPCFYYKAIQNWPSGTSIKNLYHFTQIATRGKFSQFDYGIERNLIEYKSAAPPDYDLSAVTMPVVLIAGRNDRISLLPDVETLIQHLPNVVKYIIIDRKLMNHLDFIWGANMNKYLFPHIFDILKEFNS